MTFHEVSEICRALGMKQIAEESAVSKLDQGLGEGNWCFVETDGSIYVCDEEDIILGCHLRFDHSKKKSPDAKPVHLFIAVIVLVGFAMFVSSLHIHINTDKVNPVGLVLAFLSLLGMISHAHHQGWYHK